MWSRFPGARTAALIFWAGSALAQDGDAAFQNRDFPLAQRLWREEAASGSAEAMLGLGLMNDLGLGVPRDAALALRWYLGAAEKGLPEAQFNVGVMLDSGAGGTREAAAAAAWYSRAAANGHGRAQYNLGLLYEAGEGVPRNTDLARLWLGRAAGTLTAARDRLQTLGTAEDAAITPPQVLAGALTDSQAELAWAAPAMRGGRFHVEVIADGQAADIVTDTSAILFPLTGVRDAWWRVSRIAGETYAASGWQPLREAGTPPRGRVRILNAGDDQAALRFADELAATFSSSGVPTSIAVGPAAARSTVSYRYAQDRDLARSVAAFLPGMSADDAALDTSARLAPGEVAVTLVGGPA